MKEGLFKMLSDLTIKAEAAMSSSYSRGLLYFRQKRVKQIYFNKEHNRFYAKVRGSETYNVMTVFNEDNELEFYTCECQAFENYEGACKHVIAVLKEIQQTWNLYVQEKNILNSSISSNKLMDFYQDQEILRLNKELIANTFLTANYNLQINNGRKQQWLEFSIGNKRLYKIKDILNFLEAIEHRQEISFGKSYVLIPQEAIFDEKSQALLEILQNAYKDIKQMTNWNINHHSVGIEVIKKNMLILDESKLKKYLDLIDGQEVDAYINLKHISDLRIIHARPPIKISIKNAVGGLKLSLDLNGAVYYFLDDDFHYIFHNERIYKVDAEFAKYIKPLFLSLIEIGKTTLLITDNNVNRFFNTMLPTLEKFVDINIEEALEQKYYRATLAKNIYLDRYNDGISARIEFDYEDKIINPAIEAENLADLPANSVLSVDNEEEKTLIRNVNEEKAIMQIFTKNEFMLENDIFVLEDEAKVYEFFKNDLAKLMELAQLYYTDSFKNINIRQKTSIIAGVSLNSDNNFLELSIDYHDMQPQEFIDLLKAYRLKKKYYRMKDASYISLENPEYRLAAEMMEQLNISSSDLDGDVLSLPKHRALYIDSIIKENQGVNIERNASFKKMVQDVLEPEDMDYPIPEGLQGDLRNYQKKGFKWLKTLAHYGFGGILADDMGLGKTFQVLAFILSEKSVNTKPSIVIVPTALVYHWQEEVEKFTPELKLKVIYGQQSVRQEQFKEIETADIVVTSYGLLKRDIKYYKKIQFNYCFLDEAQHIKNPQTLNAKTVKEIRAKGYFALTGTPIENSLTELWSVFDFLMPGYLSNHSKFKSRFETPIVKNNDEQAMIELRRHIKPFIIRRLKRDVLKELPEKIESKISSIMTEEQRKLYNAYLMQARKEFEEVIMENGFQKSQIKILTILTRLRQICCHPGLFIENYSGGSGKMELLMELLEDAINGGHRILLFSQFTSMLAIIKVELDSRGIRYEYLDGKTKAKDRIDLVNSFNSGDQEVFLISLKAGGTGLNLTGADMVIHYDPWWNPAVEEQATDRAYRIGQKNKVQSIKLISKDSIEEKIYELQLKKKQLIDSVIKPGESFINKMSEEELRQLFD